MVTELFHYGTHCGHDQHRLMEEVTICQIESVLLELEKGKSIIDFIESIIDIKENSQAQ
jgi:hypothetical protein